MITILVDHNIEGHAMLLAGTLSAEGWLDLVPLRFVTLAHAALPYDSNDRELWRVAQDRAWIVLTANRRMQGEDSLEQTIREESTPTSLPVVTIGTVSRMVESTYRARCAERLLEILLNLESYRGTGRLFIP